MTIEKGSPFEGFAPIMKVDEERREVSGILAIEMPDHSREIMDYERSAPHFKRWSEEFKTATDGKSAGNLQIGRAHV